MRGAKEKGVVHASFLTFLCQVLDYKYNNYHAHNYITKYKYKCHSADCYSDNSTYC